MQSYSACNRNVPFLDFEPAMKMQFAAIKSCFFPLQLLKVVFVDLVGWK